MIPCTTCSQQEVQAAIRSARNGDTIRIPAGNCTWTPSNSIDTPAVWIQNKELYLIGAGCGPNGTVITAPAGYTGYNQVQLIVASATPFRISGFRWSGVANPNSGVIKVTGGKNFRIDNCYFEYLGGRQLIFYGYCTGVLDHDTLIGVNPAGTVTAGGIEITGDNDAAWQRPYILGSPERIFIEDCYFERNFNLFNAGNIIDTYGGGSYVFRYNTVMDATCGTHGFCHSYPRRGAFMVEIYKNRFMIRPGHSDGFCFVFLQGATGVIHDNALSGNWSNGVFAADFRTCQGAGDSQCSTQSGRCNGTSPFDGNTPGMMGYPCHDQVGRSTNQELHPLLVWGNTKNGAAFNTVTVSSVPLACSNPSIADHIQKNRDFFEDSALANTEYSYPHPLTRTLSSAQCERTALPQSFTLMASGRLLQYSLPSAEYVSITLYSMLGKVIGKIAAGKQGPGQHTVRVRLPTSAAGCAVLVLWASGNAKSIRITLQ